MRKISQWSLHTVVYQVQLVRHSVLWNSNFVLHPKWYWCLRLKDNVSNFAALFVYSIYPFLLNCSNKPQNKSLVREHHPVRLMIVAIKTVTSAVCLHFLSPNTWPMWPKGSARCTKFQLDTKNCSSVRSYQLWKRWTSDSSILLHSSWNSPFKHSTVIQDRTTK